MIEIRNCPVCGNCEFADRYQATFESDRWQDAVPFFLSNRKRAVHGSIKECRDCGFVFTSPQFESKEYALIYGAIPRFQRVGADARFAKLQRLVLRFRNKGRLLDLGCGDGGFLRRAADSFQALGVDAAPLPQEVPTPALDFVCGDVEEVLRTHCRQWEAAFDVVTAWDLLEHLPNLDEFVRLCRAVTASRGLFFCTVPDVRSLAARVFGRKWNCLLLEHLWYFDRRTLATFMRKHGFASVAIQAFWFPTSPAAIAARLGQTYTHGMSRPCRWLPNNWTIHLPIGLLLGVFRPLR